MIKSRSGGRGRTSACAAATVAGSLLLTGCGSGDTPKNSSQELHSLLPASIRSTNVLRIGADLSYAPIGFKSQDGKPAGVDVDIANAVGGWLGVRIEMVDTGFDKLLPGLQAKQYDAVMSGLTDNRQRREGLDDSGKPVNPGVDFVDYFMAGSSILVAKGNPKNITTVDDLCGQTVAVQRGTTQEAILQRQVGACDRIKKPITIRSTETDKDAMAQVAAGKAVADLNDYPVAAYAAKPGSDGSSPFQIAGLQLQPVPYGIAVTKDNAALRDVLAKAVNQVIQSSEYEIILKKWNVSGGAAQNAVVNGGF